MMVVLGAGGHVGSAVADNLLQKGEKVIVVRAFSAESTGKAIHQYRGDDHPGGLLYEQLGDGL